VKSLKEVKFKLFDDDGEPNQCGDCGQYTATDDHCVCRKCYVTSRVADLARVIKLHAISHEAYVTEFSQRVFMLGDTMACEVARKYGYLDIEELHEFSMEIMRKEQAERTDSDGRYHESPEAAANSTKLIALQNA
jgi:hypothetical protein